MQSHSGCRLTSHRLAALPGSAALVAGCAPSAAAGQDSGHAQVAFFSALCGIALTLALLHLLLFVFERRDRRNLYFAAVAAAFAAVALLDYYERAGERLELPVVGELQRFAISALILCCARLTYSLFGDRAPRRMWVYTGLIAALLLVSMVHADLFPLPAGVLGLIIMADVVFQLLRHLGSLEEGAWILGLGGLAFALGGSAQLSLDLADAWRVADRLNPYLWGGVAFLVAISIYLARSFAGTRRDLERRLEEVEVLSRERLERERAAREEEVRRRLLEADNRRKTEELEAARELQIGLSPASPPDVAGLELAARMRTATEVGGDFYDFRPGPDGALTAAVADAVGHGARAGTLVAAIKSLFAVAPEDAEPAELLERFSGVLRRMGLPRSHVCLVLARFEGGRLRIASAGMPPPLVRRVATGEVEELATGGLPLGGELSTGYASVEAEIEPGDVVLLLSDGLPELPDAAGRPLGYEAVRHMLREPGAGSAGGAIEVLMAAAEERTGGGPPADDITLVAIRRE